ncbi:DMT family transporter [Mesobacillus zeae]|uniref:DMT family transporter n=1 Tax=Mesobacillus zeae TaxID=1917180 RepID=A0A398B445_9BACI|nr:DMT family transporter [Mesobacillus zeae]RID84184.1 DMT family transporter [Mesobacillus zeae]
MKHSLAADFSLLMVALVWGATFVLVQNAIAFLEPFSFNFVRFALAAVLLFLWLFLFERTQLTKASVPLLKSGFILGLLLFIGYAFQTMGLELTSSSKTGFITGMSVVMVPLFSIVYFRQRLGFNALAGVIAAAAGLYFMTMTDINSLNLGDGLVFICAIAFALHIVMTGKFSSQYPALLLTTVQISTVAVLSGISSFLFEGWENAFNPKVLLSGSVLSALLITSILATAAAFLIQTNFQKHTTATRVALIFAMEPVFAAVTGYLWAGDRLSYSAIFGCCMIFAGMILAEMPGELPKGFRKIFILPEKKGADREA